MAATCPVCGCESTDSLMCHADTSALERELGDVGAVVTDLDVTISRMSRVGGGGKGGLASERTPIHLGAVGVADDLQQTLVAWAVEVTGDPIHQRWENRARRAASILLSRMDLVRRHPEAAKLTDEVTDAIRQARKIVDRPADRVYLGVCMFEEAGVTCEAEVFASPGASEVRCRVCGITHEVAERRAWLLKRAEDMLLTVREAAQMVGDVGHITVTEASIRGYIHRKRIAYRPGGTLIRLGDLLAVVVDEGERRTA